MKDELRKAIQQIAGTDKGEEVRFYLGEVKAVDESELTCTVLIFSGSSEIELEGVNLSAIGNLGFVQIPKVDSSVLVSVHKQSGATILCYSEIDKLLCKVDDNNGFEFTKDGFVWNGGKNNGLVKVKELTEKLNALEKKLNDLIGILKGVVVPLAPAGTYPFAPLFASASPLTPTQQTEIENTQIKH